MRLSQKYLKKPQTLIKYSKNYQKTLKQKTNKKPSNKKLSKNTEKILKK
jgi:hypothetical protein